MFTEQTEHHDCYCFYFDITRTSSQDRILLSSSKFMFYHFFIGHPDIVLINRIRFRVCLSFCSRIQREQPVKHLAFTHD